MKEEGVSKVMMKDRTRKFGSFFRKKFGKDPRHLTLEEINDIAIRKKGRGSRSPGHVVISRGSVFKVKFYNISELFDKAIGK